MPFDPSRWMTQRRAHPRIGPDYQAPIPDLIRDTSVNVSPRVPVQWLQGPFHSAGSVSPRNGENVNITTDDLAPGNEERKVGASGEGAVPDSQAEGVRTRPSIAPKCSVTSRRQDTSEDAAADRIPATQDRAGTEEESSGLSKGRAVSSVAAADYIRDSVGSRSAGPNSESGKETDSSLASLLTDDAERGLGVDACLIERQGEFVLTGRIRDSTSVRETQRSSSFVPEAPLGSSALGDLRESPGAQSRAAEERGAEGASVRFRGAAVESGCVSFFSSSSTFADDIPCGRERVPLVEEVVQGLEAEEGNRDTSVRGEEPLKQLGKMENESAAQAGMAEENCDDRSASVAELLAQLEVPAADVTNPPATGDGSASAGAAVRGSGGAAGEGGNQGSGEGDRGAKRLRTANTGVDAGTLSTK